MGTEIHSATSAQVERMSAFSGAPLLLVFRQGCTPCLPSLYTTAVFFTLVLNVFPVVLSAALRVCVESIFISSSHE